MTYDLRLIFLIGMPGSGKSYWAEQLSEAYGFDYIDMDDEIEDAEDMSITEIFDKYGEDWFRQKEKEVLGEIINHKSQLINKTIIATGGGTPCFFDNMEQMKQNGQLIYLRAQPQTLINRILNEIDKRPLLAEQTELIEYAQELLNARKNIYEQAHHILDTESISLTTFEQILK